MEGSYRKPGCGFPDSFGKYTTTLSPAKLNTCASGDVYAGTIDVKVYPTVKVYLPNRNGPMVTINTNDSIFWDYAAPSIAQAGAGLISETEMLKEASEFAGTVPVKYMLPHWKTASRYLFTSGSVNMRDAAVYVRENNWQQAIEL